MRPGHRSFRNHTNWDLKWYGGELMKAKKYFERVRTGHFAVCTGRINRIKRLDLENFLEKCVPDIFRCVPDELTVITTLTVWT